MKAARFRERVWRRVQRVDRQPAIEMNIFAAAEEGCMASKD
jgi:hypothetical protein